MSVQLPDMPPRIARLKRDSRGYPIPAFVDRRADKPDGEPDFRVMNDDFRGRAARHGFCWVCGDKMSAYQVFVIGPMCVVNRVSAEPPSHRDCAEWSARACPFLSRPRMRRNEKNLDEHAETPGVGLKRNPGCVCLYETKDWKRFSDGAGSWLIRLGDPTRLDWVAEGRKATAAEVRASIDSGYPLLLGVAEQEGRAAIAELERLRAQAERYLPAQARFSP